jgi:hypothetical protein
MKLMQTAGLVFTLTLASGALGALVGAALGAFAPAYYSTVFPGRPFTGTDQIELGLGLGLTQGLTLGSVLAVVVALIVAWRERSVSATRLEELTRSVDELRRQVILLQAAAGGGDDTLPVAGPASQQVKPAHG